MIKFLEVDMNKTIPIKKTLLGFVRHKITINIIEGGWSVICLVNGEVNQEIQVDTRGQIARAAKEMLAWEDMCGNLSMLSTATREEVQVVH